MGMQLKAICMEFSLVITGVFKFFLFLGFVCKVQFMLKVNLYLVDIEISPSIHN